MTNILLSGCNGRMGQCITQICKENPQVKIVAGYDINTNALSDYPVYSQLDDVKEKPDVVIDFSNSSSLETLLAYCVKESIPVVLCTTGYSDDQLKEIREASQKIAIFKSGNMSLGINLIMRVLKDMGKVLGNGYDVEIIEKHHNQKLDAPSGTALMLADAVSSALPYTPEYIYNRQPVRQKRNKNEIGIHAVRGGTIVGEHDVIFAGLDEVIEIRHSISSRTVFANGAVNAAIYMSSITAPGLYDMTNLIDATI